MVNKIRELIRHTFQGGRFEDHGIDVDAMQEVIRYKNLIGEVAKELWRRNNPDRQRLPRNFEDAFALRFYTVESNCATIPLSRFIQEGEDAMLWNVEDELDDAVDLVCATIDAANNDSAIPDAFPKMLLSLFVDYGKSLRDDEWIEHRPSTTDKKSRYDAVVQKRLTRWIGESYMDQVDISGEVTMARVNRPRMAIEIDGREIEAEFRPEDEETITMALRNHVTARLQVRGQGQFNSEGLLQKIVSVQSVKLLSNGKLPYNATATPIWETFARLSAEIPKSELDKLPDDGAARLDDYLYGRSEDH